MATLINNTARRSSFEYDKVWPSGLDLTRCEITRAKGDWRATDATFRSGQGVMINSDREVLLFDAANGSGFLGVAKWDKVTTTKSVVINEEVTFGTAGATAQLDHPNVSNLVIRPTTALDSTPYTVTTHYTVNATTGGLTHVDGGGGFIDEAEPVYVSYTWDLTASDQLLIQGVNFNLSMDYSTLQDNLITVIEAPAVIFTTEYATNVAYTYTGATSNIYCNSSGIFTSSSSSAKLVGKVFQVPTAGDPYLGIQLIGQVAANT